MNVVLFTDTYPPFINGVSTSCYNLVKTLKDHGHDVLVVTPRAEDGPLELKGGVLYVPGIEMKKLYGYRITTLYSKKIFNIVKQFKPDIIHNQTDFTIGQFAKITSRKLHVPIVYTYHTSYEDYTYYVTHGFLDRLAKKFVHAYSNSVANHSVEFITPSDKTKDYMRLIGSDIYINVIPTGIDFSLFSKDRIKQEQVKKFKKEHKIGPKTKVFLILGRVAKEKSMDVSIRCFSYYKKHHPDMDLKLLVVGNGPQKAEYEELVNELEISEYVDFIGAVPASEVPFYYNLCDIYTSASITETQGLTFMEAMASRAIVIARFDDNLSGTIMDGKTGFFFTDEESFSAKCDKIFSLPKEELETIKNNAIEVCDIYSIERFYQNIMEVYKRAIRKFW